MSKGRLAVLLAFAAFLPALLNGFVDWDDPLFVVRNAHLPGDLHWMLTDSSLGLFQPLAWLSLAWDRHVWGLDPFGFHLTNLMLHAFNAGLVYMLGRRLLKDDLSALTAALLFAVHPLRAEPVVWAAARRDLLSSSFYLLTTLFYMDKKDLPALACFAAGLLSKGTGIGLPAVLYLLEPRGSVWPFAALSLVFGGIGALAAGGGVGLDLAQRAGMAAYGAAFYLRKTLWPSDLCAYYEIPVPFRDLLPVALGSAGLLAVLAFAAWKRPVLRLPLLSYLALIFPVLGFVQAGRHLAADRYAYLACIPLALAVGRRRLLLAAVPVLFALSWVQAGYWSDSLTLWTRAAKVWPRSSATQNNLATALSRGGRDQEALVHARAAVRIDPGYRAARENLGLLLARMGRFEEAAGVLEGSPKLRALVYFNWGNAQLRARNKKRAAELYKKALADEPKLEGAARNLRLSR